MIKIAIPGKRTYEFEHLLLDVNGTIALDGEVIEGVAERLQALSNLLDISAVTANTQGNAQQLGDTMHIKIHTIDAGDEDTQKLALLQQLGKDTICIGNGCNDVSMLKQCALGICVVGCEGTSIEAIVNSDLVVFSITDALDLLLKPNRLIGTLRK